MMEFILDNHPPELNIKGVHRTFSISDKKVPWHHHSQQRAEAIGLLRYLADKSPDERYPSDARLLEICGRPANLHQILSLDDWQHPDLAEDELPSSSKTLIDVASVLATGDPALRIQRDGNTDWHLWM